MLQQSQAEDFVISTGRQHSVRQFIAWAGLELGIVLEFRGEGSDEIGVVRKVIGDKAPAVQPGSVLVRIDPRYFRPTEVETLLGDPGKAMDKLGWTPEISVEQMCREMVAADLLEAQRLALLKQHGYEVSLAGE
jgi:GDPmannose 4,6-dehydratase